MTEHQGLPVMGYVGQSDENVALANEGKMLEERVLRWLDRVTNAAAVSNLSGVDHPLALATIGRRHVQTGFMWAIRCIFKPTRIPLPEDTTAAKPASESPQG